MYSNNYANRSASVLSQDGMEDLVKGSSDLMHVDLPRRVLWHTRCAKSIRVGKALPIGAALPGPSGSTSWQ